MHDEENVKSNVHGKWKNTVHEWKNALQKHVRWMKHWHQTNKHIARIYEQLQKHARFVLKSKKTNASTKTSKFGLGNTTTSGDDKKQKSIEMQK